MIKISYRDLITAHYTINGVPPQVTGNGHRPGLMDREGIPVIELLIPLRRFNKQVKDRLDDYDAARKKIVDTAREKDEDDAAVLARDPKAAEKLEKLLDTEVELSGDPIPLEAFAGFKVRGRDVEGLGALVAE